ncbi:MAG: hypothetical protein SFX18_12865 [Pirellulales bacterium]|nr:hypothetical protein [Pirellulales bacterium]
MNSISVHLPDDLHEQLRDVTDREGTSVNQFILVAITEKISALLDAEYLLTRAERGSAEKFNIVMQKVSNSEPEPHDRLE